MLKTKYHSYTRHVVQAIALTLLILLPCKATAMNNDTIVIVCNEMSAPYSFSKGGVPVGLHISLAQEAMKRIGRPYKIVLASWNNCISMLLNRKADIIFGLRHRETLESRGIIFGTKLSDDYEVAIYKDGSKEPDNLSDLRKMKVLVGRSSYEDELLSTEVPAIPHDVTERSDTAFLQVANGKYDVTMTSFQVASDIISYQKLYDLRISDKLQINSAYYIAGNNRQLLSILNMEIEKLHKDGTYQKLRSRWIPFISDKMSNAITLILCFLVALCILAYLLALLMNRKAKRAMRALKEKEKEISIAMHTGDLDVWTYDVKTRRMYDVEQAFFPKGGMNIDEFKKNIITEDWEHLQTIFKKCKDEHNDSFTYSTRLRIDQDGGLLYIENKAYIERDENDKITRVIGSCRNVTEWHKMEQKLQDSAERMHLAIKTSKMLLWEIHSDTLIVSFENLLTNIHKRDFTLPEIRNLVHPLDIKDFDKVIDIIKNHENKNFETNIRVYSNEGKRYLYFTLNGQPYHKLNGDIKSYVGFARNNTNIVDLNNELKDYAMKISYVLDTGGINTWEYDVTERDIKVFGKDKSVIVQYSEEEYMEKLSDRCRKRILEFFEKMHDGSLHDFKIQIEMWANDSQRLRHLVINGMPVQNSDGTVMTYYGTAVDITNLIEIQHKLEFEKERAEKADKLKSAFLANMSHEIRTPLNAIVGFSELIQSTSDKDEQKQFNELISKNSSMLLQLVSDILDISKIEANVMDYHEQTFDFAELVSDSFNMMKTNNGESPIKWILDSPYKSCMVTLDRNRIAQVLNNLITNAIKYTQKGHIKVGYAEVNGGLRFYVEDTGRGIADGMYDRVFRRFDKLDSFVQGIGLGMAISKSIVTHYNGEINYDSVLNEGSTFWAWIPCEMKIKK